MQHFIENVAFFILDFGLYQPHVPAFILSRTQKGTASISAAVPITLFHYYAN